MLRKMAEKMARLPRKDYDPQSEIQKYIPRQPQRLNEVSYRFYLGERKNSNQSTAAAERRKIGPIDISALDSRKGPSPTRQPAPNMGSATAKSTAGGGIFKSFGFGSQNGDDFESRMVTDRFANDPSRKEDLELGIDRSLIDPIKFVSAIDSKPIYPPYLQLADFESYLLQDGDADHKMSAAESKKKDGGAGATTSGEKDADGAATVTTSNKQQKGKAVDDPADYRAEMEEFRENISDMYYEKAVKLMEEVEERRREEERSLITI